MTNASITPTLIRELLEIAADRELPDFQMSSNLWEDLALDSYGALCLQLEVKKRLDVEISRERFPEIMTAQDLMDEIAQLLRDKPGVPAASVGAGAPAQPGWHATEPGTLAAIDVDVAVG